MHFVLIAKDGTDKEALQRRLTARDAHIKNTDDNIANMLIGAATLNEKGDMNGSVMIVDFPSREDLDAWLVSEPYVTQNVWQDIQIAPCKIGPSFLK